MRTAMAMLAVAATALPASAQLSDHLKCFKLKDSASLAATVDLRPVDVANFSVSPGCTVKARSRQLCIPVEKDVVSSSGPTLGIDGQDLTNAFLCYTLKCRGETLPASLLMSDQFGSRTLSGLRTTQLCVPAIVGAPPVTTTTTLPPGTPRPCTAASAPACDGTCGNSNFACEDAGGGACQCVNEDVFLVCGVIAGAPNCIGTCGGSYSCIDGGGGACQCALVLE